MIKKYKIILSVLLVVLVITSVIVVTGVIDINKLANPSAENVVELVNGEKTPAEDYSSYTDMFTADSSADAPLLRTAFDDVYYAMTKTGDVSFFKVGGGRLTPVAETGVYDISVTLSKQNLSAAVHYIEQDGIIDGYGLTTNIIDPELHYYDYALFRVTNMFSAFSGTSDKLLLIDTDKSNMYFDEKVYSESRYLYSSLSSEPFLNENQRTPGETGTLRADYKMFTSDFLWQEGSPVFFLSARRGNGTDIYMSGGSGENVDNLVYAEKVSDVYFRRDGDSVFFIRESDEGNFSLVSFDGENETVVKTFAGSLDGYEVDNSWILNKTTGELYNLENGSTGLIDYSALKKDFTPKTFTINDSGTVAVITGEDLSKQPVIGVFDGTDGSLTLFRDDVFALVAGCEISEDGTVVISLATQADASQAEYYQLVGRPGEKTLSTEEN